MKVFWVVIFFIIDHPAPGQDTVLNKYGLFVIENIAVFEKSIAKRQGFEMADVKNAIPGIEVDLRYAGSDNFTHRQLYPTVTTTYLRSNAVKALAAVQRELNLQGLGLKILDAYRPYSVTVLMWQLVKDERYAADPNKGSGHNRGVAVDLTIINLKTGKELNMGTGFDNFTDAAHHDFTRLPDTVLQNRLLLKTVMKKYGFEALDTEWWHYALPNAKEYELLDLSFSAFKKPGSKKR